MSSIYVLLTVDNFFIKEVIKDTPNAVEAPYYYGLASQHKLVNGDWHFDPDVLPNEDVAANIIRTNKMNWLPIKKVRDSKLLASDWTQLLDVPLVTKEAWATYRQALRDITIQPDPFNIVWPTPPN